MTTPLFEVLGARAAGGAAAPSPTARHQARLCLVDTLACMLSAREEALPATLAQAFAAVGAGGPAATVVPRTTLAAGAAALVNGAAAHVLDFDDYEIPGSTHPSAAILPPLLALSDTGAVTLEQIVTAYLAGYDTIAAMGHALGGYDHYLLGWHATSTIGPFGAAAAAANLLGLDATTTAHALALATSSSAGLKLQFGSDAKPLHAGLAARGGLEAALLAHAGVRARTTVGEGPHGFLARYGAGSTGAAGEASAMDSTPVLRKPWPSCAYTHRAIEAALALASVAGFDAARIASGTIRLPEPFFRVAGFLEPETPPEARFSVRYCVAAALADGTIGPATFRPEAISRPAVRRLMARLAIDAYEAGTGLEDMSPAHPDTVRLVLTGGAAAEHTVAEVKGGLRQPMTEAEIGAKFMAAGGSQELLARLIEDRGPFRFSEVLAGETP